MGVEKLANLLNANKPKVYFAIGTAGVIGTGITAYKAGKHLPGVLEDISNERVEMEDGRDAAVYRLKRVLKEAVPIAAPPILLGIISVGSFGMGQRELAARASTAIAAYSMVEKSLNAYQEKVISELGQETHDKIQNAVDADIPQDIREKVSGYITDEDVANMMPREVGDKLYYDREMNRLFWSSEQKILDAESMVNKQLIDQQLATINDFYSYLMLDCDGHVGNALGWDSSSNDRARSLDIRFGSKRDETMHMALDTISYKWTVVFPQEIERR